MRRYGRQAVLTVAEVVAAFVDFATLKTLSAWLMVSPPPMWSRCGMGGGFRGKMQITASPLRTDMNVPFATMQLRCL